MHDAINSNDVGVAQLRERLHLAVKGARGGVARLARHAQQALDGDGRPAPRPAVHDAKTTLADHGAELNVVLGNDGESCAGAGAGAATGAAAAARSRTHGRTGRGCGRKRINKLAAHGGHVTRHGRAVEGARRRARTREPRRNAAFAV